MLNKIKQLRIKKLRKELVETEDGMLKANIEFELFLATQSL